MIQGFCAPRAARGLPSRAARLALTIAVAAALPALAQQSVPPAPQSAASPVFAIKGFQVTGDNPLSEAETASVLAPYLRPDATIETLQKATAALEAALRDRGFGLHRVALPPQEVGDKVTLNIVKFTISRVTMEPLKIYDEANIRRSIPELKEGKTPNFKVLAVQTAIANESPNKQIQVGIKESDEPDKIDATVSVKESRPWTFAASLSNTGSASSGRDRLTLSGGHTNLFNRDHTFIGAYTTSIERTSDVKQLGLSYKVPLYAAGGVVGVNYTQSDVVGNFGAFSSTGAGHTFGVNYTHYLPPDGGRRSYVTVAYDDKLFRATMINDQTIGVDRRSRPLTLGYASRTETDTAVWGYNVDLAFNLTGGAGNDLASYQAEDPNIQTTRWKALRGGANYSASIWNNWVWSARGQYQYSADALISGEQFGLGGLGSVRGTSIERPLSGDKGLSATLELTTPELAPGLRALGFVDAGWLGNNNPAPPKPSTDHLASAGLGLRYGVGAYAVALDYAYILSGSRVPLSLNSAAPQRGDDRFYINLSVRF
ncbi:ShlB/FhaC/HecB family hemolysin secretion/activation protein [Caenimonas terrae]|uniref:ShlB/FhaC/HecB family hemolysin secretion/activation protein n=1 Tax=Caenimonas terrae TaxID=696074 RepID=A0ABW0NGE2_9BURK